jgi:hypothetical protein
MTDEYTRELIKKLTPHIQRHFVKAGWHHSYRFAHDLDQIVGHPAHEIMSRFGGLHIDPMDINQLEKRTADIQFMSLQDKDPLVQQWEQELGTKLIGIAEFERGHMELYVSSEGKFFANCIVAPLFLFVGHTFEKAVRKLILNDRMQLMFLPNETSNRWYGEIVKPGDPSTISSPYEEIL